MGAVVDGSRPLTVRNDDIIQIAGVSESDFRRRKPKQIVLAVPVAPTRTLQDLCEEADEIICLEDHEIFGAIGFYYADFGQLSDDKVMRLLAGCKVASRQLFRHDERAASPIYIYAGLHT